MKILLLSLLIIAVSSFTTPDKTSKKIIKLLKSGDIEIVKPYYLSKEEFSSLLEDMDPKPPAEQVTKMIEEYDVSKDAYMESFKNNITQVDWNDVKIDSTKYDYIIAKMGGDEKILWPESKEYQPNDADLVKVSMLISLHDTKNSYSMKLEMMNFKGEWKFMYWLKIPFVQTL